MRRITNIATLAALLAAAATAPHSASAQDVRILTRPGMERIVRFDDDRPIIGVTTATDSDRSDTLGVRIDAVTKDSPAEKAGLKAGDRLQEVNGVSLRAARGDAGQPDYAGVLHRRLQRELQKLKEGESIELRVLSDGRSRTVRVTPVKASELAGEMMPSVFRRFASDRAVLGMTVSSSGSARDTLGVFVQAVTADGPAEKAGIIEGDRIAAINGVSLRVAREDAADRAVGAAKSERLQREIAKLKAGDAAELTVVTAGRTRTVRVIAVQASELPGGDGGAYFFRSPGADGMQFRFDGEPMNLRIPELTERLRELAPRLEELRRRIETERNALVRVQQRKSEV
jgi:predicted metalloprotease with PDZ domain